MKAKVCVMVLAVWLICSGTALAHPYVIRPEARRPTDSTIDAFLESHPADAWDVYAVQWCSYMSGNWHFEVVAFPRGIAAPFAIVEGSDRTEIYVGESNAGYEWDYLESGGYVKTGESTQRIIKHENSAGDYSIVPPMTPLQMAMEGATTTLIQPIRQIFPIVMIIAVGLAGFARGWIWFRRLLLQA